MVLRSERWRELRRCRAPHEAGLSLSQIARETGLDGKAVRKHLADEPVPASPQHSPRRDARTSDVFNVDRRVRVVLERELRPKDAYVQDLKQERQEE